MFTYLAGAALLSVASAASTPATAIVITHVAVVDVAAGTILPDRTVTTVGDRIQGVVSGTAAGPPGAVVVDGRGAYLLPGLWDMHVHLSYARSSALPTLAANGVTYVRDLGSRLAEIDHWRGEIAAGRLVGPTIVRAGPILNGRESNRYQLAVTSPGDAAATVRALEKAGVDLIKTHRRTPREAYFALANEARRLSLPLAGHVPMTVTPLEAAEADQSTFEHIETLFEGTFAAGVADEALAGAVHQWRGSPSARELFAALVKNGTVVDPTVIAGRQAIAWMEGRGDPRERFIAASALREAAEVLKPQLEDRQKALALRRPLTAELEAVVGDLHRAGVRLVTGTDTSFFPALYPGFSLHAELEALVEIGLSPAEAVRAATLNPARLFPKLEAGEIAAGRRADLVLLDADPLVDVRNVARIRAVVLAGRLFDRNALDRVLAEAATSAAAN